MVNGINGIQLRNNERVSEWDATHWSNANALQHRLLMPIHHIIDI